ncbi:MAG: hypothetical protein JSS58_00885 [Proteobacteria bacterium]|nr:hypothetical protein [Pseudomonadota bacterium]
MNTVFYFTQSLSILERILAMNDVPTLLGGYHIDLVAAFMRTSPESADFLGRGYAALLNENIYGFFAGAWGGLYIDFGLFGSVLGTMLWGWFAGRSYRTACRDVHSDRVILYIFWLYSILIGFVSPPFGFSNSAMIFFWFVAYSVFSSHRMRIRFVGAATSPKEGIA